MCRESLSEVTVIFGAARSALRRQVTLLTRRGRFLIIVWIVSLVLGCETQKPPVQTALKASASHHEMVNPLVDEEDDSDGMEVSGILGSLDQSEIQTSLKPYLFGATRCFNKVSRRAPYLGGTLTFFFRISRDGQIKKLALNESTMGNFKVERCVYEALSKAVFAKPRGGEAEFYYPMEFRAKRRIEEWNADLVQDALSENAEELFSYQEGAITNILDKPQGLTATFYLNRHGRIVSVGMTAEEALDEEFVERFIRNLKKLKFSHPKHGYAKVSYRW